jgi:hypothetical protein
MEPLPYKSPSSAFVEVQYAGNPRLFVFLKGLILLLILFLGLHLFLERGRINGLTQGLIAALLLSGLGLFFLSMRLITEINGEGITVRYPPFQPKRVHFPWSSIARIELRSYQALSEYNGWGIKTGISGRSYTIKGDQGIQVMLQDGTRVLIGTRFPDYVREHIQSIRRTAA